MSSPNYPSMDRLAELQQMIADFAQILRVPPLATAGRQENDVEHSYGLAITCWYLVPKIAPKLDLQKILLYALAHDVVELHSGDTWVFDAEATKTKSAREDAAIGKLAADWADFPELAAAARDYKNKIDAEAKFVYTIDKILPSLLTKLSGDKDFWTKRKVTREMHEAEKTSKMQHSPEALPYLDMLNAWIADPDNFYKPE